MRTFHGDKVSSRDLCFLKGGELIQIILDPYEVRFVFDSCTEVRSAHVFTFENSETGQISEFDFKLKPRPNFYFYQLIFEKIELVDADADNRLTLIFESGDKLSLLIEGNRYESLQITKSNPLKNEIEFWMVF